MVLGIILRNIIHGDKSNRWNFPVKNRKKIIPGSKATEATEMMQSFLLSRITDCMFTNLLIL